MSDYHINVSFSDEDGGYVADIPDLKGCSAFGRTPEEAVAEVVRAKKAWLAAAEQEGIPIPDRATTQRSERPLPPAAVESPSMENSERPVDKPRLERAVAELLSALGEDPQRTGLRLTPERVAGAFEELLSGTAVDPASVLEALPGERGEGLILVREIPLYALCEHHLLPFIGKAAVAYLPGPDGRICGLSKLARLIEVLSTRLTVQERLVSEAADALEKALSPRGVFILVEAEHLCMTMRGAQAPGSVTVTTEVRGAFRDDPALRAEALALARATR